MGKPEGWLDPAILVLWYAVSSDKGAIWSTLLNVTSINSANNEHQSHLYHDASNWWLYFAAFHADGRLAIYRAIQGTPNDWNSWVSEEIVMGAGNTSGIGEPTLTDAGDLFFTVICENPEAMPTIDMTPMRGSPWVAEKRPTKLESQTEQEANCDGHLFRGHDLVKVMRRRRRY